MEIPLTSNFTTVRFGTCTVNVAQREIWQRDVLQTVPHKVFDLLILLLVHHDVVISKQVLQQQLWGSRQVAENLLAKIVVQLRHAIGDDAAQPVWIKTVHRVGYRFVGTVTKTSEATPAPRPAPAVAGPALRRIALLPAENLTGERQFVWVELGLTTLIGQALETDSRVGLVPMQMVLKALDGLPPETPPSQRAERLRLLLGTQCVVWSSLSRGQVGLQLDYQMIDANGPSVIHGLNGDEAVQLGERMATDLIGFLFPEGGQTLHFGSDDPFISQLLARATQFYMREQWRHSIQLLRTTLILEPANMAAGLLLLTNLVMTADKQAFEWGEDLLTEARSRNDVRTQGIVHTTLARCMVRRDFALARQHLNEALRICEPYESESWVTHLRLVAALRAHFRRDLPNAREQFHRLLQQAQVNRDQLIVAMTYLNLGLLEWDDGQRELGRSLMQRVLTLMAPSQSHTSLYPHAMGELAAMSVQLGAVSQGQKMLKAATELAQSTEKKLMQGSLLANALDVYADVGDGETFARLAQSCAHLEVSEQPFDRATHAMASGQSAGRSGRVLEARNLMMQAIDTLTQMEYESMKHAWLGHWLSMEVRAGDFEATQKVMDQIEALPTFADDNDLQAAVIHAEAACRHASGHDQAALQLLRQAASLAPQGRIKAHALLDAAWLHLERGEMRQADELLQEATPWMAEHPCGLALAARRAHLQGQATEAIRLQRASIEALARAPSSFSAGLLAAYSAGALHNPPQPIDPAPRLISIM